MGRDVLFLSRIRNTRWPLTLWPRPAPPRSRRWLIVADQRATSGARRSLSRQPGALHREINAQPRRHRRYDRDVAGDEPHVLVVAHRTAATPRLLEAVRRRAQAERCRVTLLVPKPYWDPDTEEAELVVELAVPLLEEAAGRRVEAVIGDSDPVEAVRQVVEAMTVNEVIVSTLPERVSRWLHRDVPSRLQALGLPVTVVTAEQSARSLLDNVNVER
jgi:hypothetical protein